MARDTIDIIVTKVMIQKDGDCSKCYSCGDPIYGKMFTVGLEFNINGKRDTTEETKINLCQSCCEEIIEAESKC